MVLEQREKGTDMGPYERTDSADAHVGSPLLEDYFLGLLSDQAEFDVEAHLLRCPHCRAGCDELGNVAAVVATLPPAVVQSIEESTRSENVGWRGGDGRARRQNSTPLRQRPADGRQAGRGHRGGPAS